MYLPKEACCLCSSRMHVVYSCVAHVEPSKIEVIWNNPTPSSRTGERGFLDHNRYSHRSITSFAMSVGPLHAATLRKAQFRCTLEMQASFDALKDVMTSKSLLAYHKFWYAFCYRARSFLICCWRWHFMEGRRWEAGCTLVRPLDNEHVGEPVFDMQQRSGINHIELRQFRVYHLVSKPFGKLTDHQVLRLAFSCNDADCRNAQWLEFLMEYDLEFFYSKGSTNEAADFLIRVYYIESWIDRTD